MSVQAIPLSIFIPFVLTYVLPANRKIRIIDIGSGLFGINLAYWISVKCENFELTVFEKSSELGGVWNHNRYPGVACDVPSHVYQYSFAPNPDWPRFLSPYVESLRQVASDLWCS